MKYESIRLNIRKLYIKSSYKIRRKKIKCEDFTIISNNCWGGLIYQSYGLKYNTPTIGLYFIAEDYIKFIYDIKKYLQCELNFIDYKESKIYKFNKQELLFPIAKLGDIEIYFMHYKSEKEAKEKWERRTKRINWNKILFKFSNQNFCEEKHIKKFMELPEQNKICFVNKKFNVNGIIKINQLIKTEDIRASYEPFGNNKYVNINEVINNL